MRSSSGALTSFPTPNVKMRGAAVPRVSASASTTAAIAASERWPTVGRPSVRKSRIGSDPSATGCRSDSTSASCRFVPPVGRSPSR